MKKRLFIAFKVDIKRLSSLETAILKLKKSAKDRELELKWTPTENMHVTLCFLGEQSEDKINLISNIMDQSVMEVAPFQLKFDGLGGFPEVFSSRVVWVGVQNKNTLQHYQQKLSQLLELNPEISYKPEYEYTPHMTICRLRNPKSVKDFISPFVRTHFGSVEISTITLFESHLQGHYPIYKPLYEIKLKPLPHK